MRELILMVKLSRLKCNKRLSEARQKVIRVMFDGDRRVLSPSCVKQLQKTVDELDKVLRKLG